MRKMIIICDGCEKPIEQIGRGVNHYLIVKDETLDSGNGLQTLSRDYPIIENELTFHDIQCLANWAMNQ